MRVDPFFVGNLVGPLDQTQLSEQQLTAELSSGVRVTAISDDPVAAGQNVLLINQMQRDDSFTQSSSLVGGQMQVTDSALGSVITQLTAAISAATEANNGTMDASDLKSISNQIAGIRDEVLSLANTTYQGNYIFAGSKTDTTPFALNNSTSPATVTYNGDTEINSLQTPNGLNIQLNVPGSQIFTADGVNVIQVLNNLVADFQSGTINGASIQDTTDLNSALNYVSQQRVVIDNALGRLNASVQSVSGEKTQLTVTQTNLMQADVADVATKLSLAETQQSALETVIAQLGSNNLFSKL